MSDALLCTQAGTKAIKLTNCDKYTLVDEQDYENCSDYRWRLDRRYVWCRKDYGYENGVRKQSFIYLHRLLISPPKGMVVDHIDGNPLNNIRNNLRICTHSQNLCNQMAVRKHTSKYKGVSWDKRNRNWNSRIGIGNNTTKHIGSFEDEVQAAIAYNNAALKYFGEFAKLNIIGEHK